MSMIKNKCNTENRNNKIYWNRWNQQLLWILFWQKKKNSKKICFTELQSRKHPVLDIIESRKRKQNVVFAVVLGTICIQHYITFKSSQFANTVKTRVTQRNLQTIFVSRCLTTTELLNELEILNFTQLTSTRVFRLHINRTEGRSRRSI